MDQENTNFTAWTPGGNLQTDPTDVSLIVGQFIFRVHKEALISSSDYFKAMFSSGMQENEKDSIPIKLVNHKPFQTIVQSFYTEKLDLNEENVFEVTEASHILQLNSKLFSQCSKFLRQMINAESCFEVMYFCDSINLADVYTDARRFCLANFSILFHSQSFLTLSFDQVVNYLSDKYLVVHEEIQVFDAIRKWFTANKTNASKEFVSKLIASSVYLHNKDTDLHRVASMVLNEPKQFCREEVLAMLGKRERYEDVFMFWSLLNTTTADGLVDIVKLCQDSGQGVKVGSMTDVVESPGYDLGSAFCIKGCCVFLSGGGPSFGKVNWIRKIYQYDLSQTLSCWEPIGDLYETRRHHAMVVVGSKLYIFGGFGKFRTKNIKLDCFDTLSGNWEVLPATPTHEIKPVTTTDQHRIFYIDRTHVMHCFDISSSNWTSLTTSGPVATSPPVAMLSLHQKPGSLLIIMDDPDVFIIQSLLFKTGRGKQECNVEDKREVPKRGKFEGSVVANGKLFIFEGNNFDSDVPQEFVDYDPIKEIVIYCTKTKTVLKNLDTNVKKALAFMAVPYLPSSFTTGSFRSEPN